jgi:small-conductance mechanosensitive channel
MPGDLGELLQTTLFTIGATETSVARALVALGVVLGALGAAWATRRLSYRHFERRGERDSVAAQALANAASLVVLLIGLDVALHLIGIRPTALFAAGGLFALVAGFAVKDITQNVLSGVMLHLEQAIRAGDVITVDDRWVQVDRLGARITTGTTYDGQEILIPNSDLAQSVVTNLTRHDRRVRIDCQVGVAYSSDLDHVRRTLESSVAGLEWRSQAKDPAVYLRDFGDSSVDYLVTVWIEDVGNALQRKSELLEAVWRGLKEAEIEIAFPQLDVHVDRKPTGP